MRIRAATRQDLAAVGDITVAAYADFTTGPTDPYLERLQDARDRFDNGQLLVAEDDGTLLGTVTRCPAGSSWRELARDGEGEFRMLAVSPAAQGRGVGRQLVQHVLELCQADGERTVVLSSLAEMTTAHRIYRALGFQRLPERDWAPLPGVSLLAFARHDTDRPHSTDSTEQTDLPGAT